MDPLSAYKLGLVSGLHASGDYRGFLKTARKVGTLVKAAEIMKSRGKTGEKLEKFAAWYSHILPALSEAATWGAAGGAIGSGFAPGLGTAIGGAVGAIPGLGYGLYKSLTGAGSEPEAAGVGAKEPPPQFTKLLQESGIPPELVMLKRPGWLSPEVEQQLSETYGVNPMMLIWQQKMKQYAEQQKAKREEEAKAKRPKFGQILAKSPGLANLIAPQARSQQFASGRGPSPLPAMWSRMQAPGGFQGAAPRWPAQRPPYEQQMWRKWLGKSPGEYRAEREALNLGSVRTQQARDFEDYARQALGV
jgi:hypothetical protein